MGYVTDAHGVTFTNENVSNELFGFEIVPNKNCTLTKVTKHSNTTAQFSYLYDDSATPVLLDFKGFVGDDSAWNYPLTSGVHYHIIVGTGSEQYTRQWGSTSSYPFNLTNLSFISRSAKARASATWYFDGTDDVHDIVSITTYTAELAIMKINIGDDWKDVESIKINIGDAWKQVLG